jgi:hypothetical protein
LVGSETGVESHTFLSEKLESAFQGPNVGGSGPFHEASIKQDQSTTVAGTIMKCSSFDWISSWAPAAKTSHGGRASLEFLKENPEEDASVHVVL